jgi:hypothetical protein
MNSIRGNWKTFLIIALLVGFSLKGIPDLKKGNADTLYLPLICKNFPYISPFGITIYGAVSDVSGLQRMKEAGCGWVATFFDWKSIEPNPPSDGVHTYNWTSFDRKVSNIRDAGMEPYVLFTGNPAWAAPYPGGPVDQGRFQDLLDMARAMTERYDCDGLNDAPGSPCVAYWSFYAEPDNGSQTFAERGWGYWGHNGSDYAQMIKEISHTMHTANPRAMVLIGGVAYDYFEPNGPFVRSFLSDTLTALNLFDGGGRAYLDALAFHYYPLLFPSFQEKVFEIKTILDDQGLGNLPLVSPEVGYWSSSKWGSSESNQAVKLIQIFTEGLALGVRPLIWYKIYDSVVAGSEEDTSPGLTTGLLRKDGSPKLAYYAYQTLARELTGASFAGNLAIPGLEGYVFRMPDGKEKFVFWSKGTERTIWFPYLQLKIVDILGHEHLLKGIRRWSESEEKERDGINLNVMEKDVWFIQPIL